MNSEWPRIRLVAALCLLAVSVYCFRNVPEHGLSIGLTAGVSLFLLGLNVQRRQLMDVLRAILTPRFSLFSTIGGLRLKYCRPSGADCLVGDLPLYKIRLVAPRIVPGMSFWLATALVTRDVFLVIRSTSGVSASLLPEFAILVFDNFGTVRGICN